MNQEIKPQPTTKFIPAKIAQKCPVCNGFGTLKYGSKICQACDGKGYVLVPAESLEEGKKEGLYEDFN